MMNYFKNIITIICFGIFLQCQTKIPTKQTNPNNQVLQKQEKMNTPEIKKSNDDWKKTLTDEEYYVLRNAGTERAFTGKYTDLKEDGSYYCKACGNLLFTSTTKYHSGCGWPAFYDKASDTSLITQLDNSHGMTRIEVLCRKCHSHLGHVFNDGPIDKTGLRYCINSISMNFEEKK